MLAANLRSAKERTLFVFAQLFSGMVWLAIVVSLVGLFYAPFVAIAVVVAHAFVLARITNNSIRVGTRQFPDLYKRIENAASKLGMQRMPEVYVTTGGGVLNAFATKLFSRSFVILNSEILDACNTLDEGKGPSEPRSVDFIIGHELGHLALGHLSWNWLLWPAKLCPLLGPAYSRACEYSCDACGLAATDDVEAAGKALAVLSCGGKHAREVSLDALVEQRHDTGAFISAIVELNSSHPYLSKRVAAVQRIRDGGFAPEVGRNPLSYLFAPFFAGTSMYIMMYVVTIGVFVGMAAAKDAGGSDPFAKMFAAPGLDDSAELNTLNDNDNDNADTLGALAALDSANQPKQKTLEEIIAEANAMNAQLVAANGNALAGALADEDEDDEDDANDVAEESPRFEARSWLKGQMVAKNPTAMANLSTSKTLAFVETLYKTGSPKVWVSDIDVGDDGIYAGELVAEMPVAPAVRRKLVKLCTTEFAKQGYQEPCEDGGVDALYFYWE